MLKSMIVTIDAMGMHNNIAQLIRDKEADYALAVKDDQPKLPVLIVTFFAIGQADGRKHCPHSFDESVEKDHDWHGIRRCWAFEHLQCLSSPEQWPALRMFGVIETERLINGKTSIEFQPYIDVTGNSPAFFRATVLPSTILPSQ